MIPNNVRFILEISFTIFFFLEDSEGDTALHCAVYARRAGCMHILLNAGADPTLVNFKLITPIHLAAQIGFVG